MVKGFGFEGLFEDFLGNSWGYMMFHVDSHAGQDSIGGFRNCLPFKNLD